MLKNAFCPYCRTSCANSDDHVFSNFLGGSETIRACQRCNNRFGHDFEGRVSKNLAPLFFGLWSCGIPFRNPITLKNGYTDKSIGLSYDLTRDEKTNQISARLSGTIRTKNESGGINFYIPDLDSARRKSKELQAHGKRVKYAVSLEEIRISQYDLGFPIDSSLRRLILKMCIAFCRRMNEDYTIVDQSVLLYLSDPDNSFHAVHLDCTHYPLLDAVVSPLAHSIYIEACPQRRRAYALVQLFGAFQFFTILHNNYQGAKFAAIGTLNPLDFSEKFQLIDPILNLVESPNSIKLHFLAKYLIHNMLRRLDNKIYQTFGENKYTFAQDEFSITLLQI